MKLFFASRRDLPSNLVDWNEDHVKSFFIQQGIAHSFLPLCQHVDGFRLQHLYEMCLSNRESMYQALKHELNERYRRLLPIADYLTFLQSTKSFVPTSTSKTVTSTSSNYPTIAICNLM